MKSMLAGAVWAFVSLMCYAFYAGFSFVFTGDKFVAPEWISKYVVMIGIVWAASICIEICIEICIHAKKGTIL